MTRRERQRRRRKHAHPVRRAILLGGLLLSSGVIAAGVVFALWVVSTANSAPNLDQLLSRAPGQVSEIFAGNGQRLSYMASDVLRSQLTQAQEPELLREATVAIEDRRFFQHGGVDYEGLLRAAIKDVLHGGSTGIQGGSTLTMQLVTNIYLPVKESHNLRYKIVQAKLATELEDREGKESILTQYLNDVDYGTTYGQTAIGVAAASQMFFDKPVSKLDLAQIALLGWAFPQAPSRLQPVPIQEAQALNRRAHVLNAMLTTLYISGAQARTAESETLEVKLNDIYQDVRQPYVVDYVKQQLVRLLGQRAVDGGGLKVYTTINLADQQYAAQAMQAERGATPGVTLLPRRWSRSTPPRVTSSRCRTRPPTAPARARQPSTTPRRGSGKRAQPSRRSR